MWRVVILLNRVLIRRRHRGLVGGRASSRVLVRLGVGIGLLGILLTLLRHLHLILLIRRLSQLKVSSWREDVVRQIIGYLLVLQIVLLNLCCYTPFLNHTTLKLSSFVRLDGVTFTLHRLEWAIHVMLLQTFLFISIHDGLIVAMEMVRRNGLSLNSEWSSHYTLLG